MIATPSRCRNSVALQQLHHGVPSQLPIPPQGPDEQFPAAGEDGVIEFEFLPTARTAGDRGVSSSSIQRTSAAATKCKVLRIGQVRMIFRSAMARSTTVFVASVRRRPIAHSAPRQSCACIAPNAAATSPGSLHRAEAMWSSPEKVDAASAEGLLLV